MKILFVSDVYFPRINGVSTSIRTFVEQLQILGHTVHLIAPDYGVATEDENWIKRIPARGLFFDPEDKLMKYGKALDGLSDLLKEHYDVVHIHTPFVAHYLGLKLAHLLNVPSVETYHTFFEDYLHLYLPIIPKGIARSLARTISRKQCNAVDSIIAPSQPMLEVLRGYGVTANAEVIPTGLQAHSFANADGKAFRTQHGIALDRPLALYVGRVAHEKNIPFLLHMLPKLLKQVPNALLVIAGEGPAEESLHALSQSLGLQQHVQFIGYLDRKTQLNACYQAADVFVFASKSETQGLVLLEAMAQGTPVVAIAELGTKSILVEGQGALIAPDDHTGFAARLATVLKNSTLRQQLSASALSYVQEHWTARVQAEKLVMFYQSIIK